MHITSASVNMKRGDTKKQKSIEFLIDVPIGSLNDEPEDNSRVWPGKRRLVDQIYPHMLLEFLELLDMNMGRVELTTNYHQSLLCLLL